VDHLVRGIDAAKTIRVVTAITTDIVREAARRHGLAGAATVLLGRGLTAGCLLTTLTKNDDERVRIAMQGDGPLGRLLIDARSTGEVRGSFVSKRVSRLQIPVEPGRPSLGPRVGEGRITVTRDLGLEQPYQGVVKLRSGELDEDLERYLNDSEQLPSVLRCHVEVNAEGQVQRAAGVLGQTFPGSTSTMLDPVKEAIEGDGLPDVLRQDRSAEALMGFALAGGTFQAQPPLPLRFSCDCGRERALAIVSTLGADDIDALADERGGTEVRCTYCGDDYALDAQELHDLASELRRRRS